MVSTAERKTDEEGSWGAYAIVDDMLVSCIVVDVDRDAAEGGDFGREFGEAGVVLSVGLLECVYLLGTESMGGAGIGRTARGRKLRTWRAGEYCLNG